jgi:phosphoribosylglycinamide formyltransferase 2
MGRHRLPAPLVLRDNGRLDFPGNSAMTSPELPSLGTPLSATATRVMLLGAGELGKEVLIALQRLGVETIAVDRYANAPGQQVAHHARTIAMSDAQQLQALIEAERPDIVVPEIEAIATPMLEQLEAAGVVRVIPTARAARLTMNREGIRRLAAETLGLPTSPYRFCDSLAELQAAIDTAIGYPCIVKPVMSSSGKGQSRIDGPDDVQKAWDYAMAGGRVSHGRVIVEGVIEFDYEITLLTVRARGADGSIQTHFCAPIGHVQVKGDYVESWQPHAMQAAALAQSQRIAKSVTDDLGGQGIFGVELFVKGEQVWFSEVSPRPHDTGMVTLITQWQNEFELHARAILGLPVDTSLKCPGASAVIYGGVDGAPLVFDGVADALAVPNTDLRLFGKPESFLRRRMGVALAHDADVEAARRSAKLAAGKVRPRLG